LILQAGNGQESTLLREVKMYTGINLAKPIFEIGLKGYIYGDEAVGLAREADRISRETGVTIILDPQCVDISRIVDSTDRIFVFAQHMDPNTVGRGAGGVLPEALKAAGTTGTLLNHAECRMTLAAIARTIERADQVGLATMVCADSIAEVSAVAQLRPNIILAEPPDLIGSDRSVADEMQGFVKDSIESARRIDPDITVMCSAGIKTPQDVACVVQLGVEATGSSSGILLAQDPVAQMEAMVQAMGEAWRSVQAQPAAR
jgi:triosephosphate isomerase (TIM)